MNAFLQRGENAIFLIKHNTDYVHNLKILSSFVLLSYLYP